VNLQWKAVHETRELNASALQAADQFAQFLLGGDHQPESAAADDAEVLDDSLKVEHLLDVARHDWPTSSMTNTKLLPRRRRSINSMQRRAKPPG